MVERLLADPPRVHEELNAPADLGVWLTERECYEFIADRVRAGARTLETGLGVSTALFLALGADNGVDPVLARAVRDRYVEATQAGFGAADIAAIVELARASA